MSGIITFGIPGSISQIITSGLFIGYGVPFPTLEKPLTADFLNLQSLTIGLTTLAQTIDLAQSEYQVELS